MSYKIIIEEASFVSELMALNPKLIVADRNVSVPTVDYPIEYLDVSEAQKNFEFYFQILNIFAKHNLNRCERVVIVGGGVLIDVASFAASTFKRGINYINVPTTSLSMIDSSVGSKNGLNYLGTKNLIGNITDPERVIIDIDFLKTLDRRNLHNGLAEAIKIGYLSNPAILELLDAPVIDIEAVIKLAVEEKLSYVKADKQDRGYRNYLNFGHTFGHALESITDFEQFYHGEAVSVGMVIASGYDPQLIEMLNKFDLPTKLPLDVNIDRLIELMHGDKKNTSDKIKLVLKNPKRQIVEMTSSEVKGLFDLSLQVPNQVMCSQVTVNRSKSHIHRLLAGALATKSQISFEFDCLNDLSDDVTQTINVLKNSNAQVEFKAGRIEVDCRRISKPKQGYYIYKSATTYRMFAPILCSLFGDVEIELDEQLASRPHTPFDQYRSGAVHSLRFERDNYQLDGSISSQFISGYIFALIASGQTGTIEILNEVTSAPYIDMTIEVAREFGSEVTRKGNLIEVAHIGASHSPQLFAEPDFSSLAYFITFNKLAEINCLDARVKLPTIDYRSLQADSRITEALEQSTVDMSDCPDLLPTLVVYGLLNKRGIKLINVDRIKYKECDRAAAMIANFGDLEAIKLEAGVLTVTQVEAISGRKITTFGDHRIAMAASIIAPFCQGSIEVDDYTVVGKSFPTFFSQLLGGTHECLK